MEGKEKEQKVQEVVDKIKNLFVETMKFEGFTPEIWGLALVNHICDSFIFEKDDNYCEAFITYLRQCYEFKKTHMVKSDS